MPSRHAVPLTPSVFQHLSQLPRCEQNEQSNFHSPYTLPSSVSCKSSACHSYENGGGVHPVTFRFFDVQMCSLHPEWGYGTRGQHVFESPACRDPGLLPSPAPQCYHSEET